MTSDQALPALKAMLETAGVRRDAPDAGAVYIAFKDFARQPVEGVEDGVLYEIGVYGFGEPETFQIGLVRQFGFFEDGEYDRMEQLHCTLHYEPESELRSLGTFNAWADSFPTLEEFFSAIDARPEWSAVRGRQPIRLQLEQWQV
jgi:hypothetical protein